MLRRRHVLAGAALLLPATAHAAEPPERPIRMNNPLRRAAAGHRRRMFAEELAKVLGQPATWVDNKGGAGGLLGTVEGVLAFVLTAPRRLLTSQGTTVPPLGLVDKSLWPRVRLKDPAPVTMITG